MRLGFTCFDKSRVGLGNLLINANGSFPGDFVYLNNTKNVCSDEIPTQLVDHVHWKVCTVSNEGQIFWRKELGFIIQCVLFFFRH